MKRNTSLILVVKQLLFDPSKSRNMVIEWDYVSDVFGLRTRGLRLDSRAPQRIRRVNR